MVEVAPVETLDGAAAMLRVNASAWRAAFDDILPPEDLPPEDYDPDEADASEVLAAAESESVVVLLARDGDDVVGFGEFRWGEDTGGFVDDGEAELRSLYVAPERWGEGIGTTLLSAGRRRLPESTAALVLHTFRENDQGRAFYEARGFRRVGEHSFSVAGESYPTVVYALRTA